MSDAAARRVPRNEPLTPANLHPAPGTALEVVDFGDEASAGLEGMSMDEQLTPFLRMLQGLSPELNPTKAEHVPGAQLGMIINSATREAYSGSEGLDIVVCAREHNYGLWIPRDLGGGFRGAVPADDPLVTATLARAVAKYGSSGKFKLPRYRDGRWSDDPARTRDTDEAVELVETGQLYVLYGPPGALDDTTAARAIVAMTSTALPVYQGLMTRHNSWRWRQPDGTMKPAQLWSYRHRLTTRADKNAKGEYFVWSLVLAPPATTYREALIARDDPIFEMGREFYQLHRSGGVKADFESGAADAEAPPF